MVNLVQLVKPAPGFFQPSQPGAITRQIIRYRRDPGEPARCGKKQLKRLLGALEPVQGKAAPDPAAGILGRKLNECRRKGNDRGPFHGDGVNVAAHRENIWMRLQLGIDQFDFVQRGLTIAKSQPALSGVQMMTAWRLQLFHRTMWLLVILKAKQWNTDTGLGQLRMGAEGGGQIED